MCYFPYKIVNPSLKAYTDGHHQMLVNVGCGVCEECQSLRKSEYYFRSYYEWQDVLKSGGYVYMDVLTYSDRYVPHVSDVVPELKGSLVDCHRFDRKSVQLFMKRLRSRLEFMGLDVKSKLRYFMSSEYGEDENRTHRPHYHFIFYVRSSEIHPYVLSKAVSDSWSFGRTDGVVYRGEDYIRTHSVLGNAFGTTIGTDVNGRNVMFYVSKYVQKDQPFMKMVNNRIDVICKTLREQGRFADKSSEADFRNSIFNQCKPFHRSSQNFGASFLDYNDLELINDGKISIPDKDKGKRIIPLPMYMKRKIWYDFVRDEDGVRHWRLNDKGREHNRCYGYKIIENLSYRMQDWHQSLDAASSDYVDGVLDGRSWYDYASYIVLYAGRVKTNQQVVNEHNGIFSCPDFKSQYDLVYNSKDGPGFLWSYCTSKARRHFGCNFLTNRFSGYSTDGFINHSKGYYEEDLNGETSFVDVTYDLPVHDALSVRQFIANNCINDKSDPRFNGYDVLTDFYIQSLYDLHCKKQDSYLYNVQLSKRLKAYGRKSLQIPSSVSS